ncbi:2Fe-2S iron-sulfur cluster-binding protein [Algiphilus sp. W345]|uniref:2Fe-2S iron-sulfur cluster-binding protein n=1 Tax=Banduia mediterranea TaxID=3075609 RepID=A0ABU2WE58_9GAMM|nr:2Fe-2S iron-sulfur cluster-binding protein [Algiphilus sp. W345]MDT0496159.1 2Fe-2S iron-sulfur cluster-binding protein [Algiphilus sp. W345]MDT0496161.1 2Fe-2S iron-sulfur cluster-binding protein [Algiphilus sp. W345]
MKITYIDYNGTQRDVEVEAGTNLRDAALNNAIPGIDGDCGGECACATCHVRVDPAWLPRLPTMGDQEKMMLEMMDDRDERSRLGCQIHLSPELDGLVVHTPMGQH